MLFYLLFLIVAVAILYIYQGTNKFVDYWIKRGVKVHCRYKILGPFWEYIKSDKACFEILNDIYNEHQGEPAVVLGPAFKPNLFVLDPENVQCVLQTDFGSFNHRGFEPLPGDLLSDNILFQNGKRWKVMRQHMTPIFTSAKLKNMYYIMDKSAQDFIEYLNKNPEKMKKDGYDTLTTFYAAAIGASVFGINSNSIFDNPFQKMALKALEPRLINNIKFGIALTSNFLIKLLKLKLFSEFEDFFISAIGQVIEQRKLEGGKRHDFADLCISLQKHETLKDRETNFEVEPSLELLAAQAFFFFTAGVEPSTSTAFATLVELGRNPEQLKKLQNIIDDKFKEHNGQLTADVVLSVEELDRVINEALRMYPPIGFLTRQCTKDTVLPIGNVPVSKGTTILIPVYSFHRDPKLYPEPNAFNPDRFKDSDINKEMLLPFGRGARLCIGNRYAQLQVKTGLMYLLHHFDIKTHVGGEGIKYSKQMAQVRLTNVDIEFIPRK